MNLKCQTAIIAIFFIVSSAFWGALISSPVLAAGKNSSVPSIDCFKVPNSNQQICCYKESDDEGTTTGIYCADCWENSGGSLACDQYEPVLRKAPPASSRGRDSLEVNGGGIEQISQKKKRMIREASTLEEPTTIAPAKTTSE